MSLLIIIRHYWTSKIVITIVPFLQFTDTCNQIEFEVAEATTDLFLSHIRLKNSHQNLKKSPPIPRPKSENIEK